MKLTNAQLATLQAALHDYEQKTEGRSFGHPDSDFWKEEYANARTLHALLEHALSVEVESVQLEPATPVAQEDLGGSDSNSDDGQKVLERHQLYQERMDQHLQPLRGRAKAKYPPVPSISPALRQQMEERARQHLNAPLESQASCPQEDQEEPSSSSAPASGEYADLWDDSVPLSQPIAGSHADTIPAATHGTASAPHAPASAETQAPETHPCLPVHTHAATALPRSLAQQTPTTTAGAHARPKGSPAASSPRSSSSGSSAHHGDACGDINCDGTCPNLHHWQPALIRLIDQSTSEAAARIDIAQATQAALRAAAYCLHVDLHDLPGALVNRVRARLLKAA